jgi:hypothetical protein
VPPVDSRIDDLYKGPLEEFVAGRAALAKTLTGDEARQVKALRKPTVVPWAVNQVYWHARPVYDPLVSSGEKLRAAQIDALKGRSADVRRATDAHRKAMAEAAGEALRLALAAGAHPSPDELTKTLEAVSLARELPERSGRLTKALQPAGFEALAGVPVKALPPTSSARSTGPDAGKSTARLRPSGFGAQAVTRPEPVPQPRAPLKLAPPAKSVERKRKAEERRRKKAIERATALATRAKADEARARSAWERSKQALAAAELTLSALLD